VSSPTVYLLRLSRECASCCGCSPRFCWDSQYPFYLHRYPALDGQELSHCSLTVPDTTFESFDSKRWAEAGREAVVQNSAELQLYRVDTEEGRLIAAVVYTAGTIVDASPWMVVTSDPCIVTMVSPSASSITLSVADPTQSLVSVRLVFQQTRLSGEGCGVWDPVRKATRVLVRLPLDEWAGTASEGIACQVVHTPAAVPPVPF